MEKLRFKITFIATCKQNASLEILPLLVIFEQILFVLNILTIILCTPTISHYYWCIEKI